MQLSPETLNEEKEALKEKMRDAPKKRFRKYKDEKLIKAQMEATPGPG